MRLRDLTYPIAVLRPDLLAGGKNGGFGSPRRWAYNIADYYLNGGFDDAIFYDAAGRKLEVEKILLLPSPWWRHLGDLADCFFLQKMNDDPCDVDMELRQIGQLTLDEFCQELRNIALAHPAWWRRHSSEEEIREIFQGCATFAEAINNIGVLDPPGKERLKGSSEKAVDLRE